MSPNRIKNNFI